MRKVKVFVAGMFCGELTEKNAHEYEFDYRAEYHGPPVSLTMPIAQKHYVFADFPPVFDGLLPEGIMLEALLKKAKLDRQDYLGQLIAVGTDCIGAITVGANNND